MADQSEAVHLVDAALVRVLPEGASLKGRVTSEVAQQLLLEGRFDGRMELEGESRIVVGPSATVQADLLRAHRIVVHGHVSGNIEAAFVEITATGRVSGTLKYDSSLSIEPGARIRASLEGPDF